MEPTIRHYWEDDQCSKIEARVVAVEGSAVAFDRTIVYPGGGGQPADQGSVQFDGREPVPVLSIRTDPDGVVWHEFSELPPVSIGETAVQRIDAERRNVLARYHTVLHVLNTIALRDYQAWITGVQIGVDYSRIDFKWEGFSPDLCGDVELKVNTVIDGHHPLRAYTLPEEEFRRRPDLLRTLEVQPPVIRGRVRVVEIEGFDAQACGGTHVASTGDLGRFSIYKTENKGRVNKRLYVRLQVQ